MAWDTASASRRSASSRLRSWDRSSDAVTERTPSTRRFASRCRARALSGSGSAAEASRSQLTVTRLSVVFTPCPPGPEDLEKRQASSPMGMLLPRPTGSLSRSTSPFWWPPKVLLARCRFQPVTAAAPVEQSPSAGLRRDAATFAAYGVLATFAWLIYSLGPILPLLREEQGTSRTIAALHSLCFAAGNVTTGLLGVRVIRRVGRDGAVQVGLAVMASGVLLLIGGSLPSGGLRGLTMTAMLLAGLGGSLSINATLAALSDHHGPRSAAAVSEGNAVAAVIGLLAPLSIGVATALGLTWRPGLAVVLLLALGVTVMVRNLGDIPSYRAGSPAPDAVSSSALPLPFWPMWVALIACSMVETGLTSWTPELLEQRASMSSGAASAGVSAIIAGMALGRFGIGWLTLRRDVRALFVASLAVAASGWLLVYLATTPWTAIAALVLVGVGIAGHFPLGAVLLMRAALGQADRAVGMLGVGLGAASGAGPFALGALADGVGIHQAFLLVPSALLIALVGIQVSTAAGRRSSGAGCP